VKDSGLTVPVDILCRRSSPTAASSVESGLYVCGVDDVALCRAVSPHSRQAIRLQFQRNRKTIAHGRVPLLQLPDLPLDPEQILDVMADFVGDHVGLSKLA
jgi:hypothetical protein